MPSQRNRGRRARSGALAAAVIVLATSVGWAAEVSVSSTTLVGGRPDLADGQLKTVAPLYELVGLRVKDLKLRGFDELGIAVDAWGGLTLPGSSNGVGAADVNLAWIEGWTLKKRLRVRLGRQFVVGGAARAMFFDGLLVDYRSQLGFGLSAFAGIPVERRFANFLRGDFAFGTRAYFAPSFTTELGVSYLHLLQRGDLARQDLGFDARWRPLRALTLAGAAVINLSELRLAELDLGPRWTPIESLELLLSYRRTSPELFLPRTSIFTVFADTARDDAGVSVSWQAGRILSLWAEARALWLDGEQGYDLGAQLAVRPFRASRSAPRTSLTAKVRRLSVPSNGYSLGRLGARHTLPVGLALSVDLEAYVLDRPIRGQTVSFSTSTTATYSLNQAWLIGATLFAATTPTFESRYEAVVKLSWRVPAEGSFW